MKTKSALIKSLGGYLRLGAAVGTALLSCGLPLHARAASGSPVGTWDVIISGSRQGLAVMQFSDGGTPDTRTFTLYEIIVPKKPSSSSSSSDDSRNATGDDSRTGDGSSGSSTTSGASPSSSLFGEEFVLDGKWSFDVNGKIIGFYTETLLVCTTNSVTITNCSGGFTIPDLPCGVVTNIDTPNCVGITNGISFTGTAVPGKRLTLTGHASSRPFVFSGIPVITLTNISGNYYGTRVADGLSSVEFLTLSVSALDPLSNLIYDAKGAGGGYSYSAPGGHALLSRRGKVAFAIPFDPDGSIVRATVGGFDRVHLRFSTQGVEQSEGPLQHFIKFNGAVNP